MSEISVNIKCETCNGSFDDSKKIPMILSCGHQMCYECIHSSYYNANQIQCVKCGSKEGSQVHPSMIKTDQDLLQKIKKAFIQNDLNSLQNLEKELSQETQKITKVKIQIVNKFLQDLENYLLASSSDVQRDMQSMLLLTKKKISALMEIKGQLKSQNLQVDLGRQEQNKLIENCNSILQKAQQEQSKLIGYDLNIFQQNIDLKSKFQNCQIQIEKYQELIREQMSQLQDLQIQLIKSQNEAISERDQLKQQNLKYQQEQENQLSSYQTSVQNLQQQLSSLVKLQDIKITIVSPNQRTVSLLVKQKTTIKQIKEQIQNLTKLQQWSLDILKNNIKLEDTQTVSSLQIVNEEELQMQ